MSIFIHILTHTHTHTSTHKSSAHRRFSLIYIQQYTYICMCAYDSHNDTMKRMQTRVLSLPVSLGALQKKAHAKR